LYSKGSVCADYGEGIHLQDGRYIPYISERDGDGESGKFQYVVEILAVIDYRIFQRSVGSNFSVIRYFGFRIFFKNLLNLH